MIGRLTGTQRYALLVAVVVIVVAAYLLASGQLGNLTGADDEPEPTPEPVAADNTDNTVDLGQPATVGDILLQVQSITFPDRVRADGVWREPAQRFAQLLLRASNAGSASQRLNLDALRIVASDGRTFNADPILSAGAARSAVGATYYAPPLLLQPGLPISIVLIFELPNDAGGLQLRVSGAWIDFSLTPE